MMSHYEMTYILSAAIAETEYPALQGQVRELIETRAQGHITKETVLGRRKLAYPIRKEKNGHYVTYEFDAEAAQLLELDRQLKLQPHILRHLIVSKELLTQEEEEALAARRTKRQLHAHASETKPARKTEVTKELPKISLDKLDEKLDELLEQEIK